MDDVRRVTLHGIILAVTASAVVSFIAWLCLDPLFHSLGAGPDTMPIIRDYMPLWLVASVILAVPVNGNSAMRAAGDTVAPAMIMILMALLNFILDPILIYGWFGVPALGVMGAALSTTIAYSLALVLGLYFLVFKKKLVSTDGLHLGKLKDSVRRLVFIAIPAGIANIIQPATGAVIVMFLSMHGDSAVAAYGVATRIEAMAMIFVLALALGMAPIVGQNWGAGRYSRVHEAISTAIRYNYIWSFFIAVLFAVLSMPIANAFSSDPLVIEETHLYFWIVPCSYAFGNLVFGWSSAFNAMGLPSRAFIMILAKSALTIPAAWIGGHFYGVPGIFCAIALMNGISGLAADFTSNRAMRAMEHPEDAPDPADAEVISPEAVSQ
jgi:putative MATE family efflux protein